MFKQKPNKKTPADIFFVVSFVLNSTKASTSKIQQIKALNVYMNKSAIFITSIFFGALSWAICPLVSDRFEPFDTDIGFIIGQIIMLFYVSFIGWHSNIKTIMLSVIGLYIGQNGYAYIFSSSEVRAWAVLLLFTSIFLCIIPLIAGLATRGINVYLQRSTKII